MVGIELIEGSFQHSHSTTYVQRIIRVTFSHIRLHSA